jgi:hypothetical protein
VQKRLRSIANSSVLLTLEAQSTKRLMATEISMIKINVGDKVVCDAATANHGDVKLGDQAPAFVRAGDKVIRDDATANKGQVRLGDQAPAFFRAGDKVVRDATTANQSKVRLGDQAPAFVPKK